MSLVRFVSQNQSEEQPRFHPTTLVQQEHEDQDEVEQNSNLQ